MTTKAAMATAFPGAFKCALLVMCVECGDGVEATLPIDRQSLALLLAQRSWFLSVLSPPGQGPKAQALFGALCAGCAKRVYPAEVFEMAEERRLLLLRDGLKEAP